MTPSVEFKGHTLSSPQVTSQMAALKVNEEIGHGTIRAAATFDAEADAGVLRKAMKGLGVCVCVCVCACVRVCVCVRVSYSSFS